MRVFEVVKGYEESNINLPKRKTVNSAGYDFEVAEDVVIMPGTDKPTLVPTGIKAKFESDEVLLLFNRSSNPKKRHLVIPNSVGVIDADYYGNPDNDGHIMFMFYNLSDSPVELKKGEAMGQGIFTKFLITDDDSADGVRSGGFGSTGK